MDKKLVWRCRRGTKELDLILTKFLSTKYPQLSDNEKQLFLSLLEQPDPQLADWLCHRIVPTEQGMAHIVQRILSTD